VLAIGFRLFKGEEDRTKAVLLVAVLLPVAASVSAFCMAFGLNRKLASVAVMWAIAALL
jgi:hypothetical protein